MCDCTYNIIGEYSCEIVREYKAKNEKVVKETFVDIVSGCPVTTAYDMSKPYTIYNETPQRVITQNANIPTPKTELMYFPPKYSESIYPAGSSVCVAGSKCIEEPAIKLDEGGIRLIQDYTMSLPKSEQDQVKTFCYYAL
jgi:hypothetical protein